MQTLTLSGWTQPSDALLQAVPHGLTFDYSDYTDHTQALAALSVFQDVPQIVAWSMGGQLAIRAIAKGVLRPAHVLLIAPPYQFVNDNDFPHGMPPDTFTQFRANYAADPRRTMERFHGLIAKGHEDTREIIKQLRHHPRVTDTDRWLPWLDTLGSENLSGCVIPSAIDVTLLHGTDDVIVPEAQAEYIRALAPHARYEPMENAGHAPHLQYRERFTALLRT